MEKGRNVCDSKKLMVGEATTYEGLSRLVHSFRFRLWLRRFATMLEPPDKSFRF
jgi:hypothetical protein